MSCPCSRGVQHRPSAPGCTDSQATDSQATRREPEATLGNVSSRGVCGRDNLSGASTDGATNWQRCHVRRGADVKGSSHTSHVCHGLHRSARGQKSRRPRAAAPRSPNTFRVRRPEARHRGLHPRPCRARGSTRGFYIGMRLLIGVLERYRMAHTRKHGKNHVFEVPSRRSRAGRVCDAAE
jgi:hypothetical protein